MLAISHRAYAEKTAEEKEKERTAKGVVTGNYVHNWHKLPNIKAVNIQTQKVMNYRPDFGKATVILFLASWCIPCQKIVPAILDLEKNFEGRAVEFVYIFSHDASDDIVNFLKGYDIKSLAFKVNLKITSDFHQPALPTIYVADRFNWLTMRFTNFNLKDMAVLKDYLEIHTGY